MSCAAVDRERRTLIASSALLTFGVIVFAFGYFYVDDKMLPEVSVLDKKLALGRDALRSMDIITAHCNQSNGDFDRLVFIVIDALRADFVRPLRSRPLDLDTAMPFTEGLLETGHGLAIVSEAKVPTVTLPRVKGKRAVHLQ